MRDEDERLLVGRILRNVEMLWLAIMTDVALSALTSLNSSLENLAR